MSSDCGSERPFAYWIERYSNGNLKAQGRYNCKGKIGVWTYYFENGQINKIESKLSPYSDSFIDENYIRKNVEYNNLSSG